MLKKAVTVALVLSSLVCVVAACGTSDEDACKKIDSLCSAGTPTTTTDPDAGSSSSGSSSTVTVSKCDPNQFDKIDNASDVKDCLDDAKDCTGAIACMAKARAK